MTDKRTDPLNVTSADRERAKAVLWRGTVIGTEERVAAALADERERARAPFMRLLARLDAYQGEDGMGRSLAAFLAEHIREAAEKSP